MADKLFLTSVSGFDKEIVLHTHCNIKLFILFYIFTTALLLRASYCRIK
jgi:hypothetical protein